MLQRNTEAVNKLPGRIESGKAELIKFVSHSPCRLSVRWSLLLAPWWAEWELKQTNKKHGELGGIAVGVLGVSPSFDKYLYFVQGKATITLPGPQSPHLQNTGFWLNKLLV